MALTQLDYPVTGNEGTFVNIFPSQKALNVNFNRLDVSIVSIASGTGGVVELTLSAVLDADLIAGDFVVWASDGYRLRSSRVLDVVSPTIVEVDEVFNSVDATNGFMNYRKSWFLEARYVAENTPTDQQANVELLIKDFSQVPNSLNGSVALDVSIVKDLLSPILSISTGVVSSLSQLFKFQYRESYEGNRDGLWVSPNVAPANDTPIMLVLASEDVVFNDFSDALINIVRFVDDYPLLFSYIYSDINDGGVSNLTILYSEYTLDKQLISTTEIGSFDDTSGVINLLIDPINISDETVFIKAFVSSVSQSQQFDPSQFDPSQFA